MTAQVDAQALAASLRRLQERDGEVLAPSLQRIVDSCMQLFGVDGSGVMLADEQGALGYVVVADEPGRCSNTRSATPARARASTRSSAAG